MGFGFREHKGITDLKNAKITFLLTHKIVVEKLSFLFSDGSSLNSLSSHISWL